MTKRKKPPKPPTIIKRALAELFPEFKYHSSSPGTVIFEGVIDATALDQIQSDIDQSHPGSLTLTDIEYDNGHSLIHYRISTTPKTMPLKSIPKQPKHPASAPSNDFSASSGHKTHPISEKITFTAFKSKIDDLSSQFQTDSAKLSSLKLQTKYLGKKGLINDLTKLIPSLPARSRGQAGKLLNQTKTRLGKDVKTRKINVNDIKVGKKSWLDVTAPGTPILQGHLHPITRIINQIEDIFSHFGFSLASGPEIEWDEINFQKLRLGLDHPSRDTQETYYFDAKKLLRVHTSSVQIRYMQNHQPPIRILSPGRVYRRDTIDATHLPSFHQIEGLMVDEKTTLTDLLGMLQHTAKQIFGADRPVRFYGHNFPYTEPSLEVEVQTKQGKWLEILGCGMVHPEVLENCGIDSNKYQGWAFGMGADRLAMLKYNITDIRDLYGGDLRFLDQ